MDIFAQMLLAIGGSGVLLGAIAWLTKQIITHYLSLDVEAYKARLAAEKEKALTELKAKLEIAALEHEVKFRRVDEKVAERLENSYQLLQKLYEAVSKLVKFLEWSDAPSKKERLEVCDAANKAFNDYFYANRCYIPPALYKHIKKVADKLVDIAGGFARGMRFEEDERRREAAGRRNINRAYKDYWGEAFDEMESETTPLFALMVKAVQLRLHVIDTAAELAVLNLPEPAKIAPPQIAKSQTGEQNVEDDEEEFSEEEIENSIHRRQG